MREQGERSDFASLVPRKVEKDRENLKWGLPSPSSTRRDQR